MHQSSCRLEMDPSPHPSQPVYHPYLANSHTVCKKGLYVAFLGPKWLLKAWENSNQSQALPRWPREPKSEDKSVLIMVSLASGVSSDHFVFTFGTNQEGRG